MLEPNGQRNRQPQGGQPQGQQIPPEVEQELSQLSPQAIFYLLSFFSQLSEEQRQAMLQSLQAQMQGGQAAQGQEPVPEDVDQGSQNLYS
jgi:hypothetical protein